MRVCEVKIDDNESVEDKFFMHSWTIYWWLYSVKQKYAILSLVFVTTSFVQQAENQFYNIFYTAANYLTQNRIVTYTHCIVFEQSNIV